MSFLENISADVLSMTEDSFNDAMGYVGGKTDADQLIEETDEGDQGREKMHVLQVGDYVCLCVKMCDVCLYV